MKRLLCILRRCELSPFFCPAPKATNARLVELDTQFRRGDVGAPDKAGKLGKKNVEHVF